MRILSYFIAVALMALVTSALAAPCPPGQRAELAKLGYEQADIKKMCGSTLALFEKAYIARESGDLRTAQQLFEQGLTIEPGNALGQKLLAEVKDALSNAQRLFKQGYNAKQSGDLRTAKQLFEQGLAIDPRNSQGQKYLAEVTRGSVSSAQKLLEQAYNAKQSGDLRTAQQLFEQGLAIDPGNALAQKYLAEVKNALSSAQRLFAQGYDAKQSGDLRTAQQLFEQGLAIEPGNAVAQKYLAEVKTASSSIADMTPGASFRDCDICPEMAVIPAGTFTMGSPDSELGRYSIEGPQHQVSIARPFAVGKYELTFDEWDGCVRERGCDYAPPDNGWGRGKRPVIYISWQDAQKYIAWLSRKTGRNYRLLTEAQWEYAARAGTTTPFAFGERITPEQANYDTKGSYAGSPVVANPLKTVPVGSYAPNAFGLYDMNGNVHEWTEDCRHLGYDDAPTDGSAWIASSGQFFSTCEFRARRGGGWGNIPGHLRSAGRGSSAVTARDSAVGFRVSRID